MVGSTCHAEYVFDALDRVLIAVHDLGDASRRYAALFSRRPSWHGDDADGGTTSTVFQLHNTGVELISPLGEGPLARSVAQQLDSHGEGPLGLAFATPDLDAAYTRLLENGLDPSPVSPRLYHAGGPIPRRRTMPLPVTRTRGVLLSAVERSSPDVLPEAELAEPGEAVVTGIDHAVVMTPNADAAITLYRDGLGLRLAVDRTFPDWGMRLAFLRVGGVTVEIAQQLRATSTPTDADRLWGLSWRVRNADAVHKRLAEAGFDVSEVRPGRKPGTRVVSVKDGTCGVPTLLIEPAQPQ